MITTSVHLVDKYTTRVNLLSTIKIKKLYFFELDNLSTVISTPLNMVTDNVGFIAKITN